MVVVSSVVEVVSVELEELFDDELTLNVLEDDELFDDELTLEEELTSDVVVVCSTVVEVSLTVVEVSSTVVEGASDEDEELDSLLKLAGSSSQPVHVQL